MDDANVMDGEFGSRGAAGLEENEDRECGGEHAHRPADYAARP